MKEEIDLRGTGVRKKKGVETRSGKKIQEEQHEKRRSSLEEQVESEDGRQRVAIDSGLASCVVRRGVSSGLSVGFRFFLSFTVCMSQDGAGLESSHHSYHS